MGCPKTYDFCGIADDDHAVSFIWTENDGTPIDLTGAAARMDLRELVTDVAVAQSMSGGITDATNGVIIFTLTDTQTALLLPRAVTSQTWVYSVKLTYADLTEQTIVTGNYKIEQASTS
jgi:hypothetical protein